MMIAVLMMGTRKMFHALNAPVRDVPELAESIVLYSFGGETVNSLSEWNGTMFITGKPFHECERMNTSFIFAF